MNWNDGWVLALGTAFLYGYRAMPCVTRVHMGFIVFAWECMLVLLVLNRPWWHVDMFGWRQQISWGLLLISLYWLSIPRACSSAKVARGGQGVQNPSCCIEKTARLVTDGVYRYIRHPMYAALLYLAWAIYLKNITLLTKRWWHWPVCFCG